MGKVLRTYNFINSVKGGVGKTTLSVFLVNYMEKVRMDKPRKIENFSGNSILLDFDLQGTAMRYLFGGKNREKDTERAYLDQIILQEKEFEDAVRINELDGNEPFIHAIFSNDSMESKLLYRTSAKNNYSSAITYSLFKTGIKKMLEELKLGRYNHVIFDMPPNFDGFASTSMDVVWREKQKQEKKREEEEKQEEDMRVNMFFVTGMDPGQIEVTIEEIKSMMTHEEHFIFDNLFIVINNNIPVVETDKYVDFETRVLLCQTLLNGLPEKEKERIFIMYMPFSRRYAEFNHTDRGLNHINASKEDDSIGGDSTFNREDLFPVSPQIYISKPAQRSEDINVIYDFADLSEKGNVEMLLNLMLQ